MAHHNIHIPAGERWDTGGLGLPFKGTAIPANLLARTWTCGYTARETGKVDFSKVVMLPVKNPTTLQEGQIHAGGGQPPIMSNSDLAPGNSRKFLSLLSLALGGGYCQRKDMASVGRT